MFKKYIAKNMLLKINEANSTLSVKCVAPGICCNRFTTLCDTCKKNIGLQEGRNYYEKR